MSDSQAFTLLSGMAMLLQSCNKEAELYDVTYWYLPQLFPDTPGGIYLMGEKDTPAEQVYAWGDDKPGRVVPEDCRVIRKGVPMDAADVLGKACLDCNCGVYCLPFKDETRTFGALCLGKTGQTLSPPARGLAFFTAEFLTLAVSNIRLKKKLYEMTLRDPLTGLYNRRYMNEALEKEIPRAGRAGTSLGVVMIDLDHFKRLNDTFGHDAGDRVLVSVADALTAGLRTEDTVCRFGGEEFFVLMTGGSPDDYFNRAREIKAGIAALEISWKNRRVGPVTASLGVAAYPGHGRTAGDLIRRADQALYRAKDAGRNRVEMA